MHLWRNFWIVLQFWYWRANVICEKLKKRCGDKSSKSLKGLNRLKTFPLQSQKYVFQKRSIYVHVSLFLFPFVNIKLRKSPLANLVTKHLLPQTFWFTVSSRTEVPGIYHLFKGVSIFLSSAMAKGSKNFMLFW